MGEIHDLEEITRNKPKENVARRNEKSGNKSLIFLVGLK